ncbi:hypothetical protein HPB47_004901 [Ixodes persulcatus]|uniref:Uncharacterized protein n=1 Tax=Ixodes persulcatus TaxID=34615 RepID=A0AC60PFB7_IXOPE|nr:hypothetical protein HPB47_004901 [Ixodes persulcatus]
MWRFVLVAEVLLVVIVCESSRLEPYWIPSYGSRASTRWRSEPPWDKNSRFLQLFNVVRFPNFLCTGSWGQDGTCYGYQECIDRGGTAYGPCAYGFGVCCSLSASCGSIVSLNGTYFTSPGFHASASGSMMMMTPAQSSCAVQVVKHGSRVCQIRLDFEEFDLERPTVGNCDNERLLVTGHNANSVVPDLCGLNTGQHVYLDVDMSPGPVTIFVETNGQRNSRWNIKISQIKCDSPTRAPPNCLQYYTGPSGNFTSFNYLESRLTPPRMGYFNNLDYSICFRKEADYCSQTYTVPGKAF